jgi:HD superfamily phosphodiesterase
MDLILQFAEKAFKNYDASHNIQHGIRVFDNVLWLYSKLNAPIHYGSRLYQYALICSMLHDAIDHKYEGKGVTELDLRIFIDKNFEGISAYDCIKLMRIMSFSKIKKGFTFPTVPEHLQGLSEALQDADMLDALGETGIQRCIDFSISRGLKVPENVCLHMEEKLFLIPKYLNYKESRNRAEELLYPMYNYYELNAVNALDKNLFF